jgi:hypothetical protein
VISESLDIGGNAGQLLDPDQSPLHMARRIGPATRASSTGPWARSVA